MAYCAQQPPKGACWDHNPLITPCKDTFRPPRGTKRCESTLNITRFGHQTLFFRSLLVAFALGVSFKTGVLGVVVAVWMAALFGIAWSSLGLMIALKTKSAQATQASFVFFFPFIFLTTAFMPKDMLSGWFKIAVTINPVEYVLAALRIIVIEGWVWDTILPGLAVLATMTVGLTAMTTWLYRRETA